MSASVFPALPGRERVVSRETIYKTSVHEAQSGREDRTSWASAPRYKWSLTHKLRSGTAAPSPWGSYTELSVVQYFIDAHYANGDSFHIVDPYDGTTDRVVRFDDDSVELTKIAIGLWTCRFDLISVI